MTPARGWRRPSISYSTRGAAAGTIRGDLGGRTLLRALGGICGMRTTEGWQDEAVRITAIILDGLRFGAQNTG
jgi:hypothetical protein